MGQLGDAQMIVRTWKTWSRPGDEPPPDVRVALALLRRPWWRRLFGR